MYLFYIAIYADVICCVCPSGVGVFYCGPDGLATDIEKALKDASSSRLQFIWHKEKF